MTTLAISYLVGIMSSSSGVLAFVAGGELGKITVVVALPIEQSGIFQKRFLDRTLHLVVEDLGFAGLSLGDQGVVQHIKNILADPLELQLDLAAVLSDSRDMLLRSLGLLLLLD